MTTISAGELRRNDLIQDVAAEYCVDFIYREDDGIIVVDAWNTESLFDITLRYLEKDTIDIMKEV